MAAHPTAGHTNGLRAIAARLLEMGHEVAFAITRLPIPFAEHWPEPMRTAAGLPQAIARDGLRLVPLRASPAVLWYGLRLPRARGFKELNLALRLFTSGIDAQARRIADEVKASDIDVVVGDYLMPGAWLGARLAGRPFVALYHSGLPFAVEGAAPFGSSLPDDAPRDEAWMRDEEEARALGHVFDERLARAAARLGARLAFEGFMAAPVSEDLNLLATTAELEPGLRPLRGRFEMTGPCLPRASNADQASPALDVIRPGTRYVYVSLGTVFNGQPRVFDTILEGLARHDVQVILSGGESYEHLKARVGPKAAHVFQRVPQVPLLRKVDFVVTHGGNNTVQETLAAGRPMVVVPFGGDQLANARRVQRLGVGVAVLPAILEAGAIAEAFARVSEADVVERAKRLASSLQGVDGADRAAHAVLRLVSGGSVSTEHHLPKARSGSGGAS
ncbi:MAG: glycosyltransferase family 1 protein [Deltaproteobacteria bacterium]|nr:glycosyltransferase family 1 protein [Deltaproteobacteria bacterium]